MHNFFLVLSDPDPSVHERIEKVLSVLNIITFLASIWCFRILISIIFTCLAAEVLYAACWLVGEFCPLLADPRRALVSMIQGLSPSLKPHIQELVPVIYLI